MHSVVGLGHLVLSCGDGRLRLLDDDLLGLPLLPLQLQSLTALQLDLTRLHQLDLKHRAEEDGFSPALSYMLNSTHISTCTFNISANVLPGRHKKRPE